MYSTRSGNKRTELHTSFVAHLTEVLYGDFLVLAAVVAHVLLDLVRTLANLLDVAGVRAGAGITLVFGSICARYGIGVLDSGDHACWWRCDCDARGDGEEGDEGGGFGEHVDVVFVVLGVLFWDSSSGYL